MSKYDRIISYIFNKNITHNAVKVNFTREDIVEACASLGLPLIKNLGDLMYSFRFRRELPNEIKRMAPKNSEWIIESVGTSNYRFRLASPGKILPNENLDQIKIPDSTPEIIRFYAPGTDEQALLARVRYNRLVDLFTGLTCYSVQNHLRTTVDGIGQIEVDEIYVGMDKSGAHFVLPCQAKSPGDRFGIVQVMQDIALCNSRYAHAVCRPIALQFTGENDVALLELVVREDKGVVRLRVAEERRYRLVPRSELSEDEIRTAGARALR